MLKESEFLTSLVLLVSNSQCYVENTVWCVICCPWPLAPPWHQWRFNFCTIPSTANQLFICSLTNICGHPVSTSMYVWEQCKFFWPKTIWKDRLFFVEERCSLQMSKCEHVQGKFFAAQDSWWSGVLSIERRWITILAADGAPPCLVQPTN